MDKQENIRRRKLKFRACHRGIREMDILFTAFVKEHMGDLDQNGLDQLEKILDESDHDILAWISGTLPVPPGIDGPVIDRLKSIALTPEDYGC